MPNTDYSKTVIYKIVNYAHPKSIYVGSTTNFRNRKSHHKYRTLNPNSSRGHLKIYETIRKFGGWNDWNMVQICEFPCANRREAEKEEDKYMVELSANLNTYRAHCSKERYLEKGQEFRERLKEKLGVEGMKLFNKENKDRRIEIMGIEKYREKQKEQDNNRKDRKKEYYLEKKQKLMKERVDCGCGQNICRGYIKRHEKTANHLNNI